MKVMKGIGFRRVPLVAYTYFFLLFMIIIFGIFSPSSFFSLRNFRTILMHSTMVTIAAVGLFPVIIIGSISLSTGSIFGITGLSVCLIGTLFGPFIGLISGVLLGAILGSIDGFLMIKLKIPSFILTLGSMIVIRGLILLWGNARSIYFVSPLAVLSTFPTLFVITFLIVAFGFIVYNFMPFGQYLRAIGLNEEASKLSGISVNKIKFFAFLWCGTFLGISGVLQSYYMSAATPTTGVGFELIIITSVVIGGVPLTGGTGRIEGVFLGSLVMSILQNGLIMVGAGPEVKQILMGIIIIIAVATMLDRSAIKYVK